MKPGGNLASLTSLRFFAAFAVVITHVAKYIEPFPGFHLGARLGYCGVTFFFILSGFVLTWTYRQGDRARDFYGRRFARVWPMAFLMTLVVAGLMAINRVPQDPAGFALAVPLLQAWAPPGELHYVYNGPEWSLSCEAFFYAVFPLLIGWVLHTRRPVRSAGWIAAGIAVVVGAVLLAAPTVAGIVGVQPTEFSGYLLYVFPPFRLAEFVIGMMLASAVRAGWRCRVPVWVAAAIAVAAYAVVSAVPAELPQGVTDLWMLPAFALLIAAGASADLTGGRGVRSQGWVKLGQWSFALYLVHEPMIHQSALWWHTTGVWEGLARTAVVVLLAITTAALAYEFIERPVERWLRRRLTRVRAGAEPAAPIPSPSVGTHSPATR